MLTRLDICNMALGEVGHVAMTKLSEDTTTGDLCRKFLGQAVREVLDTGMWKCARLGVELPQLKLTPQQQPIGWVHAYQLPEDYIRIVSFNEIDSFEQCQELYEVRGRWLLSDLGRVHIVYLRDLSATAEDVHLMPPLLTRACVLNLASKLAWPLQQARGLKGELELATEVAIRKAKSRGALEEFRPTIDPASGSRWLAARGM